MNKKRLLITLGCSHTEGMGCWVDGTPEGLQKNVGGDEWEYWYELSRNNFDEKGWPKQLGKLMGYDKVLNLGWGGASASSNVKHWFETYQEEYFEDYEVTMIWLLPDSSRISFYKSGLLTDELVNGSDNELLLSWIKQSDNINFDFNLEQASWIRILQNECKLKNIKLILLSQSLKQDIELTFLVTQKILDSNHIELILNPKLRSNVCGHLNEKGYSIFAKNIYDTLKLEYNDINFGNYNDNIKYTWNGERHGHTIKSIKDEYKERQRPII